MAQIPDTFQQLPARSKFTVAAWLGAVFFVIAVALWGWHLHDLRTPEYAFRVVDKIDTIADIAIHRAYITEQGVKVLAYALNNLKGPNTGPKAVFDRRQIRGSACYFPFTLGAGAGYMEFRLEGGWKFHDIVFTRYEGREIDFSVAYSIDHPILASLKNLDWQDLAKNFFQGFLIGLGIGG